MSQKKRIFKIKGPLVTEKEKKSRLRKKGGGCPHRVGLKKKKSDSRGKREEGYLYPWWIGPTSKE